MKKSKNKILAIMLVIIFILNFALPVLVETSVVLAAAATDYDFTDELNTDRVGIGFTWTAATKTLTITGIKNSNAEITLPSGSTIDIQGNKENIIKYINCKNGTLNIKGNEDASLNIVGSYQYSISTNTHEYYASIYANRLNIISGNVDITPDKSYSYPRVDVYGISACNGVIIRDGNININNLRGSNAINTSYNSIQIDGGKINATSSRPVFTTEGESTSYPMTSLVGKIVINGGEIIAKSQSHYVFHSNVEINGGSIEATTTCATTDGVFVLVPSINPKCDWKIEYNKDSANLNGATEADIIDIYNIYRSKAIKINFINTNSSEDSFTVGTAIDYDFTDELETDRIGIGFTWVAKTKTLTITGIKNENAEIILPGNSIIDIQGNEDNVIKYIYCKDGALNIKGNKDARLNIIGSYKYSSGTSTHEYYASIYTSYLNIISGNINITPDESYSYPTVDVYGIRANNKVVIRGGNVNIDNLRGSNAINTNYNGIQIDGGKINAISARPVFTTEGESTSYPMTSLVGKIVINGGEIIAKSQGHYVFHSNVEINGGNIEATTKSKSNGVFVNVPSIDPTKEWNILYNENTDNIEEAIDADITDIYNIYRSKAIKIGNIVTTESISILNNKENICVGDKMELIAEVKPQNSTESITWNSSNENVTVVDENGVVTAIRPGTVTITVTSGNISESIDINVKCKITLDPNGVEGIEKNTIYTDINGRLQELPTLSDNANIFNKWVDENGTEVTTDTTFTTNATIYADWTAKPILVGVQKDVATYGKETIVNYDVTSDFEGTYTAKVENLPEGVTLVNNEIKFDVNENGKYKGILKLKTSNTADAGKIANLKLYVNNKNTSNNFSLEISKANSTINNHPQAKSVVYTGKEQELIDAGNTNTGTIQYSLDNNVFGPNIPKVINAGEYTIYYKVIGDNNHNDSEVFTLKAMINKADSIVEKTPAGKTLSYTGVEQELIEIGTTKTGTIEYSIDGRTFTTNIPKGINVGEYTIYYKVIGDSNHNDSEIFTLKATINKVNSSIEIQPKGKTLEYTGVEQELIEAGTTKTGTIEYSIDGRTFTTNIPKGLNAGEYTIYYRIVGDDNHSDSEVSTIVSTISKIASTIDINPKAKTLSYTGAEQVLIEPGTSNTGTIQYSIDGKTFTTNIPKGLNAGNYTVYYKVIGDNNHNNTEISSIVVTIAKIKSGFTQEPELKVVVFNGEEQEIIKAGSTNDGQILYSLDGVNFSEKLPTATNVGKYKVYYRIVGDKNHLDSEIKSIESTITDLIGDVNGDGKINARDAKLVLQYFNGKTEFTEEQKAKADVNGDGKINARDAKLILQIFNGK